MARKTLLGIKNKLPNQKMPAIDLAKNARMDMIFNELAGQEENSICDRL